MTFTISPTGCVGDTKVVSINSTIGAPTSINLASSPVGPVFSSNTTTTSSILFPTQGVFIITLTASFSTSANVTYTNIITIYPQPIIAPSSTIATCISTLNAFDLNLSFNPTTPIPAYSISWTPLPAQILTPQQTNVTGSMTPGTYSAVVSTANGCTTSAQFTILSQPSNPNISVVVPNQILNCGISSTTLQGFSNTPNVSFNWSVPNSTNVVSGSTIPVTSNTSVVSQTLIGTYTLSVVQNTNFCVSDTIISIYQNLFVPKALILAPQGDTITCSSPTLNLINASTSSVPNSSVFISVPIVGYRWYSPSSQYSASIKSSFVAKMAGSYTLVALDPSNSCTAQATIAIYDGCNLVDLMNVVQENYEIKIFPNPVKGILNLEFIGGIEPNTKVFIRNSLGQIVHSVENLSQKQKIDLSLLPNGIYFLKLQVNSEQKMFKIVKE